MLFGLVFLLIVAQLQAQELDANDFCFRCKERRNQKDYYENPTNCSTYFQCFFLANGKAIGILRNCPEKQRFDETILTCVPKVKGLCTDPCSAVEVQTQGYWNDVDDCGAYYQCSNYHSVRQCCNKGEQWNQQTKQCDSNKECNSDCLPEVAPTMPIFTVQQIGSNRCKDHLGVTFEVNEDKSKYAVLLNDGRKIDFECALGSFFRLETCHCSGSLENVTPFSGRNNPEVILNITCNNEILDHSPYHFYVDNLGSRKVIPIPAGVCKFDKPSSLEIPGFQTISFGDTMTIMFCAFIDCSENGNSLGLMSNREKSNPDEKSIVIERLSSGVLKVSIETDKTGGVSVQSQVACGANVHIAVEYSNDVGSLKLLINGQEVASSPAKGNLNWMKYCPLSIGFDLTARYFSGTMDDILFFRDVLPGPVFNSVQAAKCTGATPPPEPRVSFPSTNYLKKVPQRIIDLARELGYPTENIDVEVNRYLRFEEGTFRILNMQLLGAQTTNDILEAMVNGMYELLFRNLGSDLDFEIPQRWMKFLLVDDKVGEDRFAKLMARQFMIDLYNNLSVFENMFGTGMEDLANIDDVNNQLHKLLPIFQNVKHELFIGLVILDRLRFPVEDFSNFETMDATVLKAIFNPQGPHKLPANLMAYGAEKGFEQDMFENIVYDTLMLEESRFQMMMVLVQAIEADFNNLFWGVEKWVKDPNVVDLLDTVIKPRFTKWFDKAGRYLHLVDEMSRFRPQETKAMRTLGEAMADLKLRIMPLLTNNKEKLTQGLTVFLSSTWTVRKNLNLATDGLTPLRKVVADPTTVMNKEDPTKSTIMDIVISGPSKIYKIPTENVIEMAKKNNLPTDMRLYRAITDKYFLEWYLVERAEAYFSRMEVNHIMIYNVRLGFGIASGTFVWEDLVSLVQIQLLDCLRVEHTLGFSAKNDMAPYQQMMKVLGGRVSTLLKMLRIDSSGEVLRNVPSAETFQALVNDFKAYQFSIIELSRVDLAKTFVNIRAILADSSQTRESDVLSAFGQPASWERTPGPVWTFYAEAYEIAVELLYFPATIRNTPQSITPTVFKNARQQFGLLQDHFLQSATEISTVMKDLSSKMAFFWQLLKFDPTTIPPEQFISTFTTLRRGWEKAVTSIIISSLDVFDFEFVEFEPPSPVLPVPDAVVALAQSIGLPADERLAKAIHFYIEAEARELKLAFYQTCTMMFDAEVIKSCVTLGFEDLENTMGNNEWFHLKVFGELLERTKTALQELQYHIFQVRARQAAAQFLNIYSSQANAIIAAFDSAMVVFRKSEKSNAALQEQYLNLDKVLPRYRDIVYMGKQVVIRIGPNNARRVITEDVLRMAFNPSGPQSLPAEIRAIGDSLGMDEFKLATLVNIGLIEEKLIVERAWTYAKTWLTVVNHYEIVTPIWRARLQNAESQADIDRLFNEIQKHLNDCLKFFERLVEIALSLVQYRSELREALAESKMIERVMIWRDEIIPMLQPTSESLSAAVNSIDLPELQNDFFNTSLINLNYYSKITGRPIGLLNQDDKTRSSVLEAMNFGKQRNVVTPEITGFAEKNGLPTGQRLEFEMVELRALEKMITTYLDGVVGMNFLKTLGFPRGFPADLLQNPELPMPYKWSVFVQLLIDDYANFEQMKAIIFLSCRSDLPPYVEATKIITSTTQLFLETALGEKISSNTVSTVPSQEVFLVRLQSSLSLLQQAAALKDKSSAYTAEIRRIADDASLVRESDVMCAFEARPPGGFKSLLLMSVIDINSDYSFLHTTLQKMRDTEDFHTVIDSFTNFKNKMTVHALLLLRESLIRPVLKDFAAKSSDFAISMWDKTPANSAEFLDAFISYRRHAAIFLADSITFAQLPEVILDVLLPTIQSLELPTTVLQTIRALGYQTGASELAKLKDFIEMRGQHVRATYFHAKGMITDGFVMNGLVRRALTRFDEEKVIIGQFMRLMYDDLKALVTRIKVLYTSATLTALRPMVKQIEDEILPLIGVLRNLSPDSTLNQYRETLSKLASEKGKLGVIFNEIFNSMNKLWETNADLTKIDQMVIQAVFRDGSLTLPNSIRLIGIDVGLSRLGTLPHIVGEIMVYEEKAFMMLKSLIRQLQMDKLFLDWEIPVYTKILENGGAAMEQTITDAFDLFTRWYARTKRAFQLAQQIRKFRPMEVAGIFEHIPKVFFNKLGSPPDLQKTRESMLAALRSIDIATVLEGLETCTESLLQLRHAIGNDPVKLTEKDDPSRSRILMLAARGATEEKFSDKAVQVAKMNGIALGVEYNRTIVDKYAEEKYLFEAIDASILNLRMNGMILWTIPAQVALQSFLREEMTIEQLIQLLRDTQIDMTSSYRELDLLIASSCKYATSEYSNLRFLIHDFLVYVASGVTPQQIEQFQQKAAKLIEWSDRVRLAAWAAVGSLRESSKIESGEVLCAYRFHLESVPLVAID